MPGKKYITMRNINRPLYFFGLSGMQVIMALLIVLFCFAVLKFWGLLALVPIYYVGNKIKAEQAKGNPDYISSMEVSRQTRKYFRDDSNVMNGL
jgi:lipopolysaccharide export LptBFGC system permease protein LptF